MSLVTGAEQNKIKSNTKKGPKTLLRWEIEKINGVGGKKCKMSLKRC